MSVTQNNGYKSGMLIGDILWAKLKNAIPNGDINAHYFNCFAEIRAKCPKMKNSFTGRGTRYYYDPKAAEVIMDEYIRKLLTHDTENP